MTVDKTLKHCSPFAVDPGKRRPKVECACFRMTWGVQSRNRTVHRMASPQARNATTELDPAGPGTRRTTSPPCKCSRLKTYKSWGARTGYPQPSEDAIFVANPLLGEWRQHCFSSTSTLLSAAGPKRTFQTTMQSGELEQVMKNPFNLHVAHPCFPFGPSIRRIRPAPPSLSAHSTLGRYSIRIVTYERVCAAGKYAWITYTVVRTSNSMCSTHPHRRTLGSALPFRDPHSTLSTV